MSFHFSWSIVYIIFKIYFSFSLLENLFITFWGQKMRRFGKNRVMTCHFMSCHVMSWLLKLCWGSIFLPVFIMPQKISNFILFFKKISKFGQNHVMSCHVMSCHVMAPEALLRINFYCSWCYVSLEHWFHVVLKEKRKIRRKSCHVMSSHVKTGSRHFFFEKVRSNPERGHKIGPVCKFWCFYQKSPPTIPMWPLLARL